MWMMQTSPEPAPEESAQELIARQEREVEEFIAINPTDAGLWPGVEDAFRDMETV